MMCTRCRYIRSTSSIALPEPVREVARLVRQLGLDRVQPCLPNRVDGALPTHVIVAHIVHADERLHTAVEAGLSGVGVMIAVRIADSRPQQEEDAAAHEEMPDRADHVQEFVHVAYVARSGVMRGTCRAGLKGRPAG